MKKTTTKKASKQSTVTTAGVFAERATLGDFKTAVLLISLLINLFTLCVWITLQLTTEYDNQLFTLFIHR